MEPPRSDMPDEVQRMMLALCDQVRHLNQLIHAVLKSDHPHADVLAPLLWAAAQSSDSLAKLCFYGRARDCYVLARCVWETLLNAAYVFVVGDPAAKLARQHALQKSYRDLDRQVHIGSVAVAVKYTAIPDAATIPGLVEALDAFSNKKGGEVAYWTNDSIDERLARVMAHQRASKLPGLSFARLAIYRHASDIVHGTLFGAAFAMGLTQPGRKTEAPSDLLQNAADDVLMTLLLLQMSIHDVLDLLASTFGLEEVAKRSRQAIRSIDAEALFKRSNSQTSTS